MEIKDQNIKNEYSKIGKRIIISILLVILGIASIYWGTVKTDKSQKNVKDLNYLISTAAKKDDEVTYLNIRRLPYLFAVYDDTTDAFYFVTDGKYIYIAYMTEDLYKTIYDEENPENLYKITGISKAPSKDVKEIAIDTYNKMYELPDEEKLTLADFNNYFGDVYIDTTQQSSSVGALQYGLGFGLITFGIIYLIYNIVRKIAFKKSLKKINRNDIMKINEEIKSSDSFYYQKLKLYLTNSYIINFNYTLDVIKYDDILWIYSFIQRTNGAKTNQNIVVKDKYAKAHNVANINVITKAKLEQYDEIFNVIAEKNKNILVGYTKENMEKYKNMTRK